MMRTCTETCRFETANVLPPPLFQCVPHALAGFGVQGAEGLGEAFHFRAAGSVLVGTGGDLAHQLGFGGMGCYVLFGDKAEGADDGEGIVLHGHGGTHGVEGAFVEEVHEHGGKEIVLMMPQRNLVETMLYGKAEHGLATIAGTEEATCAALVGALVEGGVKYVQGYAKGIAECLHVQDVRLIGHIVHNHMHGLNTDRRSEDTRTLSHQLSHDQGVLASRKGKQNPVAIGKKAVIGTGFVEETGEAPLNPPVGGASGGRDAMCSVRLVVSLSDAALSVPTMLLLSHTRSFPFSVFRFHLSVLSILK